MSILRSSSRLLSIIVAVLAPLAYAEHDNAVEAPGAWVAMVQGRVPGAPGLRIKLNGGAIRVEGHAQAQITYVIRGQLPSGLRARKLPALQLYQVSAYRSAETASLIVNRRRDAGSRIRSELVVQVPTSLKFIKIVTSGGDVSVDNIAGQVEIQSAGGGIQLEGIGGAIDVKTAGRDIKVGSVDGNGKFRTEGGNISLRLVKGSIDAWTSGGSILVEKGLRNAVLATGGGDVRMQICGGELKVVSGGGNLLLGDIAGHADIRTNGGNIHLHSSRDFVRAETTGGNIYLDGTPGANALTGAGSIVARFIHPLKPVQNSTLDTPSGDISVYLPPDLAITIQASIDPGSSHMISTDIPGIQITRGDSWPAPIFAEGKLNGGGPILKVHTIDGNIKFRRDDPKQVIPLSAQ